MREVEEDAACDNLSNASGGRSDVLTATDEIETDEQLIEEIDREEEADGIV